HQQIGDHHPVTPLPQARLRLGEVVGHIAAMPQALKRLAHHLRVLLLVIDHQNVRLVVRLNLCHKRFAILELRFAIGSQAAGYSLGKWSAKSDPLPTSLATVTRPPCSSAMRRVMARPSPVPDFFVE